MPQSVSIEGLQMYEDLKQFGYVYLYTVMGLSALWWVMWKIKTSSFESGYWKGRQAGWNSHRRLTNIKKKSDEVFDYDHYN